MTDHATPVGLDPTITGREIVVEATAETLEKMRKHVDTNDIVAQRSQPFYRSCGDMHVGEKPHAMVDVFSLASQAPYLAAW